jgi:hypothetical protein
MTVAPEQLIQDIAARVAERVTSQRDATDSLPARFVLLVLSGDRGIEPTIRRLMGSGETVVALVDCPTSAASALASARALIPAVRAISADDAASADALAGRAQRVTAPALDLALASRVVALNGDSPGARVILRALLRGVPVEATLDEREFQVSPQAPAGARRAVEAIEARLRELGIVLSVGADALSPAARTSLPVLPSPSAYGAGRPHPSQERFEFPGSLNEFVDFLESRACVIEPGKPCIHCGACETRGF